MSVHDFRQVPEPKKKNHSKDVVIQRNRISHWNFNNSVSSFKNSLGFIHVTEWLRKTQEKFYKGFEYNLDNIQNQFQKQKFEFQSCQYDSSISKEVILYDK